MTVAATLDPLEVGYSDALAVSPSIDHWRIGVLETAFGSDTNPDAAPVNRTIRSAIADLGHLGVSTVEALEITELSRLLVDTAAYVQHSKSDITRFLADRPDAPVSSFMEIYDNGGFHPLNDLFHAVAHGPDTVEDVDYIQIRERQKAFQDVLLDMFHTMASTSLSTRRCRWSLHSRAELAALKYDCLTFPTNTVIAAEAGLPALTVPVGFTEAGLAIGMELLGAPHTEAAMLQFAYAWEQAAPFRRAPSL